MGPPLLDHRDHHTEDEEAREAERAQESHHHHSAGMVKVLFPSSLFFFRKPVHTYIYVYISAL
jgi:hypothetical protein